MPIEDTDLPMLSLMLSPERLGKLHQLTGNMRSAIELHQKTLRLGNDLMNVIAVIEIALRNSICENLGSLFKVPGWLLNPPPPFAWDSAEKSKIKLALNNARRDEYAKLSQPAKHALDALAFPNGFPANLSHDDRVKARHAHIQISDGKLVAALTFFIWKRLCGPDYEHGLWKRSLKKTFPNKKVKRTEVASYLEAVYQARNRLAHHEPVLYTRFAETITSIKYIAQRLEAKTPSDQTPLYRLIAENLQAVEAQAATLHAELDAFKTPTI